MPYVPEPIIFEEPIPESIRQRLEWIGEQIHECWADKRIKEGWTYDTQYDGIQKKHPCLIPYQDLPEIEKNYDKDTAIHTIQLLLHAGFKITPPSE